MGLWMRQVAAWAWAGLKAAFPYAILVLVPCAIFILPIEIRDCKEAAIRLVGLLLQLVAIALVICQLRDRLKLFGKPLLFSSVRDHLRRFPSWHSKKFNLAVSFPRAEIKVSDSLKVRHILNSSLESRVEALEGEVEDLRSNVRGVERSVKRHAEESRKSLQAMQEENTRRHEGLERLVDDSAVGGMRLEWVVASYLLVGIVLATAAPELALLAGHGGQCSR